MNSIKTAVAVSIFAVVMAGSVATAGAAPAVPNPVTSWNNNVMITAPDGADVDLGLIANDVVSLQTNSATKLDLNNVRGEVVKESQDRVDGDNALQTEIDNINQQAANGTFKGDKGDTGATGATGVQGIAGVNGNDGKDGIDGKDGTTGAQGAQGIAGANGSDGKDGINGKDGVTTTVTQLDAVTQAKVAKNSQAITTTSGQAASVAQDLKDAKSFFSQQQASNNAQFKSLHDEVDSNKKEARSGAASAVAIASMPQVEAGQTVMFSAGVGSFKDEQAMSVGASFHAGVATVKAGISDSTNNDFAMGAGVGIGF
ncbi:collagen-like triple helix repeat-containing protein [Yokenella regensburgei]|jgi:hypothetical protein|uniref:collagen-like triple helix repeat-containing protein n=1 Tax=Yokenella regensburgei TaxID=158877 RepID=UPI000241FF00|nr:collagen-like triple helix repeat-containing protein [Yokenella regensburgei]EHM45169.1 collagen triple helix repeat protein [Yokenella regensburgei ATCC 43003]